MGLFDKFQSSAALYASLTESGGQDPFRVTMDEMKGPTRAIVKGKEIVLAGTNNYLGLTYDRAAVDAIRFGRLIGCGGKCLHKLVLGLGCEPHNVGAFSKDPILDAHLIELENEHNGLFEFFLGVTHDGLTASPFRYSSLALGWQASDAQAIVCGLDSCAAPVTLGKVLSGLHSQARRKALHVPLAHSLGHFVNHANGEHRPLGDVCAKHMSRHGFEFWAFAAPLKRT